MRKFSPLEQRVIDYVITCGDDSYTFVLANAYNYAFENDHTKYDSENGVIVVAGVAKPMDELLRIEGIVIEISLLLRFLEENRYIYKIKDNAEKLEKHDLGALGGNSPTYEKKIGKDLQDTISTGAINFARI